MVTNESGIYAGRGMFVQSGRMSKEERGENSGFGRTYGTNAMAMEDTEAQLGEE